MKRRSTVLIFTGVVILAAQAIVSYTAQRDPFLPSPAPLAQFPLQLGSWSQVREGLVEAAVLEMLGPDDTLVREYGQAGHSPAGLFVAYYRTQLRAKNAHDPKVCLPGSGWNPRMSSRTSIAIPGSSAQFPANYYRIAKGDSEAVVLYWFQTHKGVYTADQELKAHRVWDAITDNRTDMALVRIVVPVDGNDVNAADARATELAQLVYPQMLPYFPPKDNAGS